MSSPRVVCIGVATLDAIVAVDRLPVPDERVPATAGTLAGGGVAATAAVALARLGVPVAFVGRIADDETGRWIRDDLAREGVDVGGLVLSPGRSPLSVVLVDSSAGTRALVPYPGDVAPIEPTAEEIERCAAADWVHVDHAGYPVMARLRRAGVRSRVSLDGGVAIDGLDLSDVTLYGPTEAALLARHGGSLHDALREALEAGPSTVVATRGADGSVGIERGRGAAETPAVHEAPGYRIPPGGGPGPASTLGAGDVFHGALLASLVEGRSLSEAMRRANAAAALACRGLDARSAIPTRAELDAFLGTLIDRPEAGRAGDPP